MTRLLFDQGLPREAAEILRANGWDAPHVGAIVMGTARDGLNLGHAVTDRHVVVTLDSDFHALVAVSGSREPPIIRIRREGL